jgi:predicted DNA-binding protein with PD1-like motif
MFWEVAVKWRLIDGKPRSYVLIFNTGDELAKGLKDFATEQNLADASFKAIGALAVVKLAWFNPETKKYQTSVDLKEQLELLSMIGDIAKHDGKPIVHAHVVVGRSDGTTAGGHLLEASVRPTCEVFLTESPVELSKEFDPDSGLLLIKL